MFGLQAIYNKSNMNQSNCHMNHMKFARITLQNNLNAYTISDNAVEATYLHIICSCSKKIILIQSTKH